jgi:pSer/pThr/pTyr-binding forkhead associated (FHA) protein
VGGTQAGTVTVLRGPVIELGRGAPETSGNGVIRVADQTVSSRQAVLYREDGAYALQHSATAKNPTLVNGQPCARVRLAPGDQISIGSVTLQVRARRPPEDRTMLFDAPTEPAQRMAPTDATIVRPAVSPTLGALVLVSSAGTPSGTRFPVRMGRTVVGRDASADVRLQEPSVSRRHAVLVVQADGTARLVHESATNASSINGKTVDGEAPLAHGDYIGLADQVVLRFELASQIPGSVGSIATEPQLSQRLQDEPLQGLTLAELLEQHMRSEEEIRRQFMRRGSFLDVDMAGSRAVKEGARPTYVALTFERWRAFIERGIRAGSGKPLNSNGDEVMSYFESPACAVTTGIQLLTELETFNREENVLSKPIRMRIGIHTGESTIDFATGVAYSAALDLAGHLQKEAETDGLLISQETYDALKEEQALFEPAGRVERDDVAVYRWRRP